MTQTYDEKVAATRARMAQLGEKFVVRTRGDVALMRASLEKTGQGDVAALADLRNLAHRACGTGATLGFEALSERAYRIELLAAQTAGATPDAATLAELLRAIDALAREVEAGSTSQPD